MKLIAFSIACLAYICHGRRAQMRGKSASTENRDALRLLSSHLLASRPHTIGHSSRLLFPSVTAGSRSAYQLMGHRDEKTQNRKHFAHHVGTSDTLASRRSVSTALAAAGTLLPQWVSSATLQLVAAGTLLPHWVFATTSNLGYDLTPMSKEAVYENAKGLTPFQQSVSLNANTERAFTGKTTNGYAHDNREEGYYVGAISGLPLFSSRVKYDSGTGWPSFWAPVDDKHVILRKDPQDKQFLARMEVLDAVSGAHLGHVFPDGPTPTGNRFCMNAAALTFVPSKGAKVPNGYSYRAVIPAME